MKKSSWRLNLLATGMILFPVLLSAQIDKLVDKIAGKQDMQFQNSVVNQARGDKSTLRQFIADSLRLVYDEILLERLDSVGVIYSNQTNALLNQLNAASERNQNLSDSVAMLSGMLTGKGQSPATNDPVFEAKFFSFEKMLRQEESKKKENIFKLSSTIEQIAPFQLQELQNYLNIFYPSARCDSVQDFITQVYIRTNDWSRAEYSILKFLYLYPDSPLFDEVQSLRSAIFQTEKFYKSSSDYLMRLINEIPEPATPEERYFKLVETLRDFIDVPIRQHFIPEAQTFLKLYPYSSHADVLSLWIAEAYERNGQPHSALLSYQKAMLFYPNTPFFSQCLFRSADIQQKQFGEYESAIRTFLFYIEKFGRDSLALDAQYRIAKMLDENLSEWERAVKAYQVIADKYPTSPLAIPALMRKAVILSTKMSLIEEAVNIYQSIDERYPGTPDALSALMASGNLLNLHKRYQPAIDQFMKVFQKYPQSEKAISALEEAVKIYSEKIKDNDKTVETLNLIIANYPGTKASARAVKQLGKLEKAKQP